MTLLAEPTVRSAPAPRRAAGIDLIGRFEDSGFKEPPYLVRRADGQVVQLPNVLYRLLEQVDGRRGHEELAHAMSEAIGRGVDADAVRFLLEDRLYPLGLLTGADGTSPAVGKVDPLLALKFRTAFVPERVTRALTTIFSPLFLSPVVIAVVAGLAALDGWLLFEHGISQSVRYTIYNPALLLVLLAGMVLATAFHEIGHATACRYGGARPGVMGVGIYIVWPAFYTDVTDAYRLCRAGRLRTDLGGVYFNAVFALAVAAVYLATGSEFLLLLVLLQNFAILQQLLPLLRLDGYYIVSDLTGVPDIFTRIKPVLQSVIPGRRAHDRVAELKPWVRMAVTGYVCSVVPVMLASLGLMVIHAPRVFATAYDSFGMQWDRLTHAQGLAAGTIGAVQIAMLVLPCAGMILTSGRVARRAGTAAWAWSSGEPARRGALVMVAAAGLALAAYTWWPNGDYRPIQPTERGTLGGAISSVLDIPSGRPSLTPQRMLELHGAPTELTRTRERRSRHPSTRHRDVTTRLGAKTTHEGSMDTSATQTTTGSTPPSTQATGTTQTSPATTDASPAPTSTGTAPTTTDTTSTTTETTPTTTETTPTTTDTTPTTTQTTPPPTTQTDTTTTAAPSP
jgi:putative peptide zinc metalloprotease protein